MVLNSHFTKTIYIDFPPLLFWSSLSELSEMLPPRLKSSFFLQIKLNSQLSSCASFYFFQLTLFYPWGSPGKNTGVGCHFLLQGIFLTQGQNPGLLQCRWILYHLSYTKVPVISTSGCRFHFGSISSFFLELFLRSSPVAYWAPTDWGVHLSVSYLFAFSYCSWSSRGKNTEVVCHSLLQWTTFVRTLHHDSSILCTSTWHGSQFH